MVGKGLEVVSGVSIYIWQNSLRKLTVEYVMCADESAIVRPPTKPRLGPFVAGSRVHNTSAVWSQYYTRKPTVRVVMCAECAKCARCVMYARPTYES